MTDATFNVERLAELRALGYPTETDDEAVASARQAYALCEREARTYLSGEGDLDRAGA